MSTSQFSAILDGIINGFRNDQTKTRQWGRWEDFYKTTIITMKEEYEEAKKVFNKWDKWDTAFIVLGVIVPIVIGILQTTLNFPTLAALLGAVFPALVGIERNKTKAWREKRDGLLNLRPQCQDLIADVVEDIDSSNFTAESEAKCNDKKTQYQNEYNRIKSLS